MSIVHEKTCQFPLRDRWIIQKIWNANNDANGRWI